MFGIYASTQTIGSEILDFGVVGENDLWIVVLEFCNGKHIIRWQDDVELAF